MKKKRYWNWVLLLLCSGSCWLCYAQAPSERVFEVERLLEEAMQSESIDSSLILASKALIISREEQYESGSIQAYDLKAKLYKRLGNSTESLRHLIQLIPLLEANDDQQALYDAYTRIGDIYLKEELYHQALVNFRKAQVINPTNVELWERIEKTYAGDLQTDKSLALLDSIYDYYETHNNEVGKINTIERQIDNYLAVDNQRASLRKNEELLELLSNSDDEQSVAAVYNNLGYTYLKIGEPQRALEHFRQADMLNSGNDNYNDATTNINMAVSYQNMGEIGLAIQYLKIAQSKLPNEAVAQQTAVHLLTAKLYLQQGDFYNALLYNQLADERANYIENAELLSEVYRQAGQISERLFEYQKALEFYAEHLQIEDSLRTISKLRQQQLLQQQLELERAEREIRLYQINEALKDAELKQQREFTKRLELEKKNLTLRAQEQEDELALLEKDRALQAALLNARELESEQTFLLLREQIRAKERERELAELRQQEEMQSMQLAQAEAQAKARDRIKEQEIAALKRQKDFNELQLENQRRSSQLAYGIVSGMVLISLLIFINLYRSRRANKRLAVKNEEIEKERSVAEAERKKSEELLLNILPAPTAAELKDKGQAKPQKYDLATVLFTDFSGFTQVSEQLTPDELIRELNICFSAFDSIMEKYGLEKIKTLGDGYMAVGGVPIPSKDNPVRVVKAALEMQEFMKENIRCKTMDGIPCWRMRVGVNSGPVVAGVIGNKKFAYDIWGDTVNIASRMESHGEIGKVNISAATYALVKDYFHFTHRGKKKVKHAGAIDMYFVEGVKE